LFAQCKAANLATGRNLLNCFCEFQSFFERGSGIRSCGTGLPLVFAIRFCIGTRIYSAFGSNPRLCGFFCPVGRNLRFILICHNSREFRRIYSSKQHATLNNRFSDALIRLSYVAKPCPAFSPGASCLPGKMLSMDLGCSTAHIPRRPKISAELAAPLASSSALLKQITDVLLRDRISPGCWRLNR
jgi:hypothetical protein